MRDVHLRILDLNLIYPLHAPGHPCGETKFLESVGDEQGAGAVTRDVSETLSRYDLVALRILLILMSWTMPANPDELSRLVPFSAALALWQSIHSTIVINTEPNGRTTRWAFLD
jgi:hypothetical protein